MVMYSLMTEDTEWNDFFLSNVCRTLIDIEAGFGMGTSMDYSSVI